MNQQPPPPMLPPGWIALWDPATNRYYFVEEASGLTQWEVPTANPPPYTPENAPIQNNNSKNSPYQNTSYQTSPYQTYQGQPQPVQNTTIQVQPQPQPQPQPVQNTTIQVTESPAVTAQKSTATASRGVGSFSGSALAGGLLGFATAKLVSNSSRNRMPVCAPPPQPARVNNIFVSSRPQGHGHALGPQGFCAPGMGPPVRGRGRRRF